MCPDAHVSHESIASDAMLPAGEPARAERAAQRRHQLNRLARRQPAAVLGVLEFYLTEGQPEGESRDDC